MSMQLGGSGGVKSDINVTPLVDVMLVLLIIMMIIAPLLQKGVDVRLPIADQQRREAGDAGPDGARHQGRQDGLHQRRRGAARTTCARRVEDDPRDARRKSSILIKADEDAPYSAVMDAMDELRASGIEDMGLITEQQGVERAVAGRRVDGSHAHKHYGADAVFKGTVPAAERGHEHHADDRRAARAPRHLHGRPAAVAAGSRRQPAGRDATAPSSSSRDQPDRARSTPPTRRSRSTSRTSPCRSSKSAAHHLRGAQGQDDVHQRRRQRCATATSSTSSTRPRAPVSRRSASSPKACARAPARAPRPGPSSAFVSEHTKGRPRDGPFFLYRCLTVRQCLPRTSTTAPTPSSGAPSRGRTPT